MIVSYMILVTILIQDNISQNSKEVTWIWTHPFDRPTHYVNKFVLFFASYGS